jgi:hypothetical protein
MRFTKSGKNWEGRGWVLAPGLAVLATQIEKAWPDKETGDGTVASKDHDQNNPTSDHRPSPYDAWSGAIVRAIDAGETSETITQGLVDAIVGSRDPRIMYVIYEGKSVWSIYRPGKSAWKWYTYTGPNPHAGHFHLSTKRTKTADNDTRPWVIGEDDDMPTADEVRAIVRQELDRRPDGVVSTKNGFIGIMQSVFSGKIGKTDLNLAQHLELIYKDTNDIQSRLGSIEAKIDDLADE